MIFSLHKYEIKLIKTLCVCIIGIFFWIGKVNGESLTYKELEIEHDLENRFLQRLERIVGKDHVLLEVDVTLGDVEIKSKEETLPVKTKPPTSPLISELPGFAKPESQTQSSSKRMRRGATEIGIAGLEVKLILDISISSQLVNIARRSVQNHPVFKSVEGARLVVERLNLVSVSPEYLSEVMMSMIENMKESIDNQTTLDSLRMANNERGYSLLSRGTVLAVIIAVSIAIILMVGLVFFIRGLKKITLMQERETPVVVNVPPAKPFDTDGGLNITIDQPIEVLPTPKEEKIEVTKPYTPFAFLRNIPNNTLWQVCQNLQLDSLEILINFLPSERAVWLLDRLDDEKLRKVSYNLSSGKIWSRSNIEKVRQEIINRYNQLMSPDEVRSEGVMAYAELLTSTAQEINLANRVLDLMGEEDGTLLRLHVFPFKDLLHVEDEILKKVLLEADRGDIALSLYEKDKMLTAKLLNCLDPKTAKNLSKRINLLENVTPPQVFEAERRIVNAVKAAMSESDSVPK